MTPTIALVVGVVLCVISTILPLVQGFPKVLP